MFAPVSGNGISLLVLSSVMFVLIYIRQEPEATNNDYVCIRQDCEIVTMFINADKGVCNVRNKIIAFICNQDIS